MTLTNCVYIDKEHKYYCNGEELISVTQCLKPLDDFSMIDPQVLERKRRLGSNLHHMIHRYEVGRLETAKIPNLMLFYFEQYLKFRQEYKELYKGKCRFEEQLFQPRMGMGGTPDMYSAKVIVDFKSRPVHRYRDALQLTGYNQLIGDHKVREYYVVELAQHKYKCTRLKYSKLDPVFLKFLRLESDRLSLIKLCKHEEANDRADRKVI